MLVSALEMSTDQIPFDYSSFQYLAQKWLYIVVEMNSLHQKNLSSFTLYLA